MNLRGDLLQVIDLPRATVWKHHKLEAVTFKKHVKVTNKPCVAQFFTA